MHASLLQLATAHNLCCHLHQRLAVSTSPCPHFSSVLKAMDAQKQLQAQEHVPSAMLAQAHQANSEGAYI
jgi:hypothetical protein